MMSSGTTPHLIAKESQTRMIGYGGMLFESFVAIMALVAAISLNPGIYYSMNTPQASIQKLAGSSYQADKSAEYNASKAIPNVAMMPDGSKLSIDWEGTTGEKHLSKLQKMLAKNRLFHGLVGHQRWLFQCQTFYIRCQLLVGQI